MPYSISGFGHGSDTKKVRKAFADLVAALDEATSETGMRFEGQLNAAEPSGRSGKVETFSLSSDEVRPKTAKSKAKGKSK